MTFQEKRRFRSVVALVVLAFAASGTVLQEALGWSFQSKTARKPSLPTSSCSDDDSMTAERLHQTLSSPSSRRSVLLTASWALLLGETAAAAGKPIRANAADDETATTTPAAPFVYTRKQTVLNKKELNYQISIPSSMNEGSKPVKTHLDEVNFVSESVKRYQYGITVDPVRISSLKEVRVTGMRCVCVCVCGSWYRRLRFKPCFVECVAKKPCDTISGVTGND